MEIPYSESCLFLVSNCMAEIVDGKEMNFWKFQNDVVNSTYGVPLVARCSTWCTVFYLVYGVPLGARSADYSPRLLNNLKHCRSTIVHSCIGRFEINMHPIFIHLLKLILIYLIYFLIKTPLIYSIYIINIIILLISLDFAHYMLHENN